MQSCQACGLCAARQNVVVGAGEHTADWLIVGDAPDAFEDEQASPFADQPGQLLSAMLRAVGLSREGASTQNRAALTNALKCRPVGNRNPTTAELAQCAPYLQRQITLVQPKVIVAMGRFAAIALTGSSEPLGKLRGRVHSAHGLPLIVTYHPAYLIRNPSDKAKAWDDLCLAADTVQAQGSTATVPTP